MELIVKSKSPSHPIREKAGHATGAYLFSCEKLFAGKHGTLDFGENFSSFVCKIKKKLCINGFWFLVVEKVESLFGCTFKKI